MTFKEIYIQSVKFWPTEIVITDGKQVDSPDWGKFNNLSKTWNLVEERTQSESEFIKLMVWAIFSAYHRKAVENYQIGLEKVFLTQLDLEYTKNKFEESLLDTESDYYADVRKEYTKTMHNII